jgi:hypothetical protein
MQSRGWVKLWREQFIHEVSERKPWCDGYAWSYLYSQANYKAGVTNFRNQYIPLERGQFITSKLKLQEIFGWSQRRTNSFLTSLETRGMCTIKVTKRFIMITICNYEKYQSTEDENEQTDVILDVRTGDEQVMTIKEVKERKNICRPPKQTDPKVKEFLNYWGETYFKEIGQPYPFSFEKDAPLAKGLLKLYSPEVLQEVTGAFFRDEWCKGKGFSFGLFKSQFGKLLSKKAIARQEW